MSKNIEIKDCTFNGVKWDGQALGAINNVSEALLNLTKLFKSQQVDIEAMLKIDLTKEDKVSIADNTIMGVDSTEE